MNSDTETARLSEGGEMRRIYLIRHGACEGQRHRCIGRTELQLSETGRCQAGSLRRWAQARALSAVYTSSLLRCRETARILAGGKLPVNAADGLREMDCGAWEGLSFQEIRARWPELYALRGEHPGTTPPPDGESLLQAGRRLEGCVRGLLAATSGDLALVTHGGAARGWLVRLLSMDPDRVLSIPQPWGGITEIHWQGGRFVPVSVGMLPEGGAQ